MFGFVLAGLSAALTEISDSLGKKEVREKIASYYTFGFLNLLFGTILIVSTGIFRAHFIFDTASLPTFLVRLALEVLQAHVSILAIIKADRSDFSVIRTLTIPLLLGVDIILGYHITPLQAFGIALIVSAIVLLSYSEHFRTKGITLIIISAVNAVITISLYKYDVTYFNSVEAEQSIVCLVLVLYFYILAVYIKRENPVALLSDPILFIQTCASGLSVAVGSFAILFAPASIITTALRAFAVLFAIVSGRFYFREKKFALKLSLFCVMALGLVLLTPPLI